MFLDILRWRTFWQRLPPEESGLETYFTDAKEAQQLFADLVRAKSGPRLLVLLGDTLIGKSTILRMNQLFCRKERRAVALAHVDRQPSFTSVLTQWQRGLSESGVTLRGFDSVLQRYNRLRDDVNTKFSPEIAKLVGAGTSLLAHWVPGVAPLKDVSQAGTELFLAWWRKVSNQDRALLDDPTEQFSNTFTEDLRSLKPRGRVALLLDQYELLQPFEAEIGSLVQRLPSNVLVNIASTHEPEWHRCWPDWRGYAEILPIRPMASDDIRDLVRKYWLFISHGREQARNEDIDEIARFACGLPFAATTAVNLLRGGVQLNKLRPRVTRDIVKHLMDDVQEAGWRETFLAAAVLRFFNEEALQAMHSGPNPLGPEALNQILHRCPFIEEREDGWAVNETIRQLIDEDRKSVV